MPWNGCHSLTVTHSRVCIKDAVDFFADIPLVDDDVVTLRSGWNATFSSTEVGQNVLRLSRAHSLFLSLIDRRRRGDVPRVPDKEPTYSNDSYTLSTVVSLHSCSAILLHGPCA